MNLLIKRILKKIFKGRENKKNILLREIAKESASLTLLDIGSAGGIERRWEPIKGELYYIGVEPDQRSSKKLIDRSDFKKYEI